MRSDTADSNEFVVRSNALGGPGTPEADSRGVTAEDVTLAYELILGRAPESAATIAAQLGAESRHSLGLRLLASSEFRERHFDAVDASPLQIFKGYDESDLEVFEGIGVSGGSGEPGFVTDFLGVRTRTSYSPTFSSVDGELIGLPVPSDFHAEAPEWIGLLKSVRSARGSFRAMELGAGWAPWLVAGAKAAESRGIREITLCGVEADAGRAAFMTQHFLDNGLEPDRHRLLCGAVGAEPGIVQWPVSADPAADYGTRPVHGDANDYVGRPLGKTIDVVVYGINELLREQRSWDLVHIDLQGLEVEVCRAGIDELSRRAAWLVIGTHSRLIEGELLELFRTAGWCLEHEKPTRFTYREDCPTVEGMTTADGIQVWRNLRMEVHDAGRPPLVSGPRDQGPDIPPVDGRAGSEQARSESTHRDEDRKSPMTDDIKQSDCFFYHTMELPEIGVVAGPWDLRGHFDDYVGNVSFAGKTVLDVGTASGFLAFEAEKRGGTVTAFDIADGSLQTMIPFATSPFMTDRNAWTIGANGLLTGMRNSFWFSHKKFDSQISAIYGSFAELAQRPERYDIVLAGAIVEHLCDPISAIGLFATLAKSTIVIASTPIELTEEMVIRPANNWDNPKFDYTWYTLSLGLYRRVLGNMGFRIKQITYARQYFGDREVGMHRPTLVAERAD